MSTPLRICLFGKLALVPGDSTQPPLASARAQELFAYLALHRGRCHPRELLASVLWADQPTSRSRQYLRKTLWQLQSALNAPGNCLDEPFLVVSREDVTLNDTADVWVDVACFEQATASASGMAGKQMTPAIAQDLRRAIDLYRGELLEGWYNDWCLVERERLGLMYISALDKLVGYSEANGEYEAGLHYGQTILRYDRAREYTHRALMRLRFLAGDRTGALHQFERCAAALREELDVAPAANTIALYERIRGGEATQAAIALANDEAAGGTGLLPQLHRLQTVLHSVELEIAHEIESLDRSVRH